MGQNGAQPASLEARAKRTLVLLMPERCSPALCRIRHCRPKDGVWHIVVGGFGGLRSPVIPTFFESLQCAGKARQACGARVLSCDFSRPPFLSEFCAAAATWPWSLMEEAALPNPPGSSPITWGLAPSAGAAGPCVVRMTAPIASHQVNNATN